MRFNTDQRVSVVANRVARRRDRTFSRANFIKHPAELAAKLQLCHHDGEYKPRGDFSTIRQIALFSCEFFRNFAAILSLGFSSLGGNNLKIFLVTFLTQTRQTGRSDVFSFRRHNYRNYRARLSKRFNWPLSRHDPRRICGI